MLLIAEAANPEWTSVPLVGWSHAQAIAGLVDAHLVTQVRNREAILRGGLTEGHDFTAIDSEAVAKRIYRFASLIRGGAGRGWTTATALSSLSYYYFERLVWKQFGARICSGEFDIVHRITPLSPTTPSLLAGKCRVAGVPFVLGPLNGGVPWPKEFDKARRAEREWLSYVRSAYKLLPGYRSTLKNAATILVGSKATWQQVPSRYWPKCVYLPENAVDPDRFPLQRTRKAGRPLRIVFLGRLVPYKGADMLLEACGPLVRNGAVSVEVVGDGPQMGDLRGLVAREGLEGDVRLAGWVDHKQVQHYLAEADLFGFPSIREFGGGAVLEAMAVGLAPVVVDYGGPGELVTDATGWRIPLGSREQIIERLRAVISEIVSRPELADQKGEAAAARVQAEFTWDAKARYVVELYERIVRGNHCCMQGNHSGDMA